jgi:hypothetical protein
MEKAGAFGRFVDDLFEDTGKEFACRRAQNRLEGEGCLEIRFSGQALVTGDFPAVMAAQQEGHFLLGEAGSLAICS